VFERRLTTAAKTRTKRTDDKLEPFPHRFNLARLFEEHLNVQNFAEATSVATIIQKIASRSAVADYVHWALQKRKRPQKPDVEIISDLIGEFKSTLESRDTAKLIKLSEWLPGRQEFIAQFLAQYTSYRVDISGFRYFGSERKGYAKVSLTNLTNTSGYPVQPGPWRQFEVVIQKDVHGQWRVVW